MSDSPSATALMRCPFCGGFNVMMDRFGASETDPRYAVSCETAGCGVIGPESATRAEAAAKWANCNARSAE
jgi:Restriction alleviation protein Lar